MKICDRWDSKAKGIQRKAEYTDAFFDTLAQAILSRPL